MIIEVEDLWKEKTEEVAKEYAGQDKFAFGNGAYFYDRLGKGNYYIKEQRRLKTVVDEMKERPPSIQPTGVLGKRG